MKLKISCATALFYLACFSPAAQAVPITFGIADVDPLNSAGIQSEAGFTYQTSDPGWALQAGVGNPGAGLVTFVVGSPTLGNTLTFLRSGGGLFTFNQFDHRAFGNSESVEWRGFVGVTQTQTLSVSSQPLAFATVSSGFTAAIDRLELFTSGDSSATRLIDNVDLTAGAVAAVPEIDPTRASLPFAFFAVGLCLLGKRSNRSVAAA